MGPGEGIQKQRLLDLPTTIETADQSGQQRLSTTIRHAPPPPRAPPRPGMPPFNGNFKGVVWICYWCDFFFLFRYFIGAKRIAPARPREQPPSLPRSPSPLGSMSSLHDVLKVSFESSPIFVKILSYCLDNLFL